VLTNPVIESMLNRKSVRKYTEQKPTDEVIETVVRAGQQAPFAAQLCSLLLTRKKAPLRRAALVHDMRGYASHGAHHGEAAVEGGGK
jgi:nitroreductase